MGMSHTADPPPASGPWATRRMNGTEYDIVHAVAWSPGMGTAPDMAADGFEDMVLTAVDLGIDPTTIPV